MRRALIAALAFFALAAIAAPSSAQLQRQLQRQLPLKPSPQIVTPLHPVIYEMDTLRTGPLPPELLKQMEPIHTLQAIEDLLKANLIPFAWAHAQVGAGALPSEFTRQIDALPPHEVFTVKQGDSWLIGVVLTKH